ncbi:MAG: GDSL-type esterase/lipase family protein [Desulfobacterales bacterium]
MQENAIGLKIRIETLCSSLRMKSIITLFLFLSLRLIAADTISAKITIMPLGDSITLGVGPAVPLAELNGYRRDLGDLLKSSGYDIDFVGSLANGDPDFTDKEHEGHPGWHDDQIAAGVYGFLTEHPAQIVLLHIGTNDISADPTYTNPADVAAILDEIDRWEADNGKTVVVVLAAIINRNGHVCPNPSTTTTFNQNVRQMALNRATNPVHADRIVMVDLECSAGLNYLSDMVDSTHPNADGYAKMATKWFTDGLLAILPQADAGADQTVTGGKTVTLSGAGSIDPDNPDGAFSSVRWEQISGKNPVTLGTPDELTTDFTAPAVDAEGDVLTFKLTVRDTDGLVGEDSVTVTITPAIEPVPDNGGGDDGGGSGGGGGCFIQAVVNQ